MFFTQGLKLAETSGSFLAGVVLFLENEVDELKAAAEAAAQAIQPVDAVASGESGMTTWVIIGVVVLAAVMLAAVYIMGRRNRARLAEEEAADNPLFEDQYAVSDDDIVIETQSSTAGADGGFEEVKDEDEEHHAQPVLEEIQEEEAEPEIEEPVLQEITDKPEPQEPAPAADNENVIPLMKKSEQAPADAVGKQAEPDYDAGEEAVRYAFAARQKGPMSFSKPKADKSRPDNVRKEPPLEASKTQAAPVMAAAGDTEQPPDELAQEQHAAMEPPREDLREETREQQSGEMRFMSASESRAHRDDDGRDAHDSDYRPRSYIAPTVLREDFNRLERLQAERLDILRDEISRQISSMKADQNNRFDIVVDALDRKLTKLTEVRFEAPVDGDNSVAPMLNEFTRQVNMLQSTLENQGQRIRAITQILDDRLGTVSHVYGEVRNIGDRIDQFTARLGEMEKSISENTRLDMMSDVQLSDVVRSSLPPDSYEFKPLLSNNHRADCIIRLPHPPGTIVVDTKFPLDAYNALPSRDEVQRDMHQARGAEDSFRRAVLRHIIDVAERFIIPGETADSALMFVPTESIYTTLHARFPDLIRDSFRARVWIVSPSTLMGTLQTLKGVLRDTRAGEDASRKAREEESLREEMEELRTRASTLARNFETTQSELRAILEATDKVFSRQPKKAGNGNGNGNGNGSGTNGGHRRDYLVNELYDRKSEWPGREKPREEEKRSSSLYEEFSRRPDPLR
ncbi:DNA recombination protein RmuC [Parvularcula flava]|uniref:DNA recombination protein RmuC homolog n=1 Tax=Aquisalinus luteolus TaxID=1566827 RepID=A0A8J3A8W3_9PROT|nr:DNA recombination protein RmuC [Aquisalinus luteolus]NHK28419.1 DNA recombination protein RmuC [Aquisalinus luteolus]GGH98417.1 hypothetical protein GCM10011355_21960 [Aquisalinus luteolus]